MGINVTKHHILLVVLAIAMIAAFVVYVGLGRGPKTGTIYNDPALYKEIKLDDIKDKDVRAEVAQAVQAGGVNKILRAGVLYVVLAFEGIQTTAETSVDRQLFIYYDTDTTDGKPYAIYRCNTEKVWVQSDLVSGDILSLVLYTKNGVVGFYTPEYGYLEMDVYRDVEPGAYILTVAEGRVRAIEPTSSVLTTGVVYAEDTLLTGFHLNGRFIIPDRKLEVSAKRKVLEFYYDNGVQVRVLNSGDWS